MNAKTEFINFTNGKTVKCAKVYAYYQTGTDGTIGILKLGYTEEDYKKFLEDLDFIYDDGFGGQELGGDIWFTDGSWADRGEYDGSEWWEDHELPEIPEDLTNKTN